MNSDGAEALIRALYASAAKDLVEGLKEGKMGASKVATSEKWLRLNPFGLLHDPEMLIEECRRKAWEEL